MEGKEIRKVIGGLFIVAVLLLPYIFPIGITNSVAEKTEITRTFSLAQYTPLSPLSITQDIDFETAGFTGTGTEGDPYVLESVSINATQDAISITGTSSFFIIRNSRIQAGNIGITLQNVSNGLLENCEIQAFSRGLFISNGDSITVDDCEFIQAATGIQAFRYDNGLITDSVFHHNDYGVDITSSNNTRIEDSTFFANDDTGLRLLENTFNITVFSCNFGWNGNRLLGLLGVTTNAHDRGNNTWISNRWSDYDGDGSYNIQGSAGSIDLFASLIVDINAPFVEGPDYIRYDEGETDNWLNWNATDVFPAHMIIYLNDAQIFSEQWVTESFWFLVDGFPLGSHNITIQYFDAAGNTVSDVVWVSVMISVFGGEGTEFVLYASLASILCVFVLMVVIKRMR
ncbi:MAG: right-handed parallel beta-helix repeat-containing protein [Candidatus Thorarchaeota archaeon]|nr:right-handed parallel beta-helix repeat-containing protein [Candidatus Thorarchaeota archaeon]